MMIKEKVVSIPHIETFRRWSSYTVQQACIRNALYTMGEARDYSDMLAFVDISYPTNNNLYLVAKNICENSWEQTITNIMYILEKEAITTTFEIDGSDEI